MNFKALLDWISGKGAPPVAPAPAAPSERRRYSRIGIDDSDILLAEKGPFVVSNLSYGGIRVAVNDPDLRKDLQPGATITGKLRLGTLRTAVKVRVQSTFPDGIGCAFVELTPGQGRLLSDFIKPRLIGPSLHEVRVSAELKQQENLKFRWFQGDDETQIFLWQLFDGEVVKQEFYFLNYLITWEKDGNQLRTGYLRDSAAKTGFGRVDPQTVIYFNIPSHRALGIGKTILQNTSLPPETRERLVNAILAEERRLYSRYVLKGTEHRLRFFIDRSRTRSLDVANLSYRGIALVLDESEDGSGFVKGATLTGELAIGEDFVPSIVKIGFRRDQVIGGSLDISGDENLIIFGRFLAPRILGQSLEETPTPLEELPFAPKGARCYLHLGVHNTHVLTVLRSDGILAMGRIVFMDQVLVYERSTLNAWRISSGIIFPRDWELPAENLEKEARASSFARIVAAEMINAGTVAPEVQKAWAEVLKRVPAKT